MMTRIAIIPARGGSKRIPRKNIKLFLGKPIISYCIDVAKQSGMFDVIMVSTDDEEIAALARNYGASVPFLRSEATANDMATTYDVLSEVLLQYQEGGMKFDYACCIYPTAALTTSFMLERAFELLVTQNKHMVMPVVEYGHSIWRSLKMDDSCSLEYIWEEFKNSRSQDLPKAFHDAGQFYWFIPQEIIKAGKLFTNVAGFAVTQTDVQDIDNLDDWHVAELKYQLAHGRTDVS